MTLVCQDPARLCILLSLHRQDFRHLFRGLITAQTINMANYRGWFISAAQDKNLCFDTSELSTLQSYINDAPSLEETVSA